MAWRRRVELAEKRIPLVRAVRQISKDLSVDRRDRRLLAVWDREALDDCQDVQAWRPAYQAAVHRRDLLHRIGRAIRSQRDAEIVRAMEDPSLADYPLPVEWQAAIEAAKARVGQTATLIEALQSGESALFWERFDARVIRRHQDLFAPYEALLWRLTESEILPLEKLGMGPALARASLVCTLPQQGLYRARWTWPQQRFSEQCILAICPDEPGAGGDPSGVSVYHRLAIDRASWEAGGGDRQFRILPDWIGGWVVVWALVDLGFHRFASPPLVLGRLGEAFGAGAGRWKRWPLFRASREEGIRD